MIHFFLSFDEDDDIAFVNRLIENIDGDFTSEVYQYNHIGDTRVSKHKNYIDWYHEIKIYDSECVRFDTVKEFIFLLNFLLKFSNFCMNGNNLYCKTEVMEVFPEINDYTKNQEDKICFWIEYFEYTKIKSARK